VEKRALAGKGLASFLKAIRSGLRNYTLDQVAEI